MWILLEPLSLIMRSPAPLPRCTAPAASPIIKMQSFPCCCWRLPALHCTAHWDCNWQKTIVRNLVIHPSIGDPERPELLTFWKKCMAKWWPSANAVPPIGKGSKKVIPIGGEPMLVTYSNEFTVQHCTTAGVHWETTLGFIFIIWTQGGSHQPHCTGGKIQFWGRVPH